MTFLLGEIILWCIAGVWIGLIISFIYMMCRDERDDIKRRGEK